MNDWSLNVGEGEINMPGKMMRGKKTNAADKAKAKKTPKTEAKKMARGGKVKMMRGGAVKGKK